MQGQEVLVVRFGRIETSILPDFRDDGLGEHLGLVELDNIRLGDPDLLGIRREDLRPVLRPFVRILLVELRRIHGDRGEDLQQPTVRDEVGIVRDPHRFGVPCGPGTHDLILSSAGRAAVVTGNRINDAADVLKHTLDTPKASPGENECLHAGLFRRFIHERSWQPLIDIGAFGDGSAEAACQINAEKSGRRDGLRIPVNRDHRFRLIAIIRSVRSRSCIPVDRDHRFR